MYDQLPKLEYGVVNISRLDDKSSTKRAGRVTISYLSGGLGIDNPSQPNLVLETTGYGRDSGVLVFADTEIDNATDSTVTGNTFSYNRLVMNHMTVQVKDGEHHVLVIYPQSRTPLTMQTDAEALEKIG